MCLCLSVALSFRNFVFLSFVTCPCLNVSLSITLSLSYDCSPICLFFCFFLCFYVYLSVDLSLCLYASSMFVSRSIFCFFFLSLCLYIFLSCVLVYLSLCRVSLWLKYFSLSVSFFNFCLSVDLFVRLYFSFSGSMFVCQFIRLFVLRYIKPLFLFICV